MKYLVRRTHNSYWNFALLNRFYARKVRFVCRPIFSLYIERTTQWINYQENNLRFEQSVPEVNCLSEPYLGQVVIQRIGNRKRILHFRQAVYRTINRPYPEQATQWTNYQRNSLRFGQDTFKINCLADRLHLEPATYVASNQEDRLHTKHSFCEKSNIQDKLYVEQDFSERGILIENLLKSKLHCRLKANQINCIHKGHPDDFRIGRIHVAHKSC